MRALVAAELLKLRTARSILLLLAVIAALGAVQVARILRAAGSPGGIRTGTQDAWLQVLGGAGTGALLIVLASVLAVTGETRHDTLTPTLLVSPRRRHVMVAKMVASGLVGVGTTLALLVAGAAVGLEAGALSGAPGAGVLGPLAGGVCYSAFLGWFGAAVGLLIRHHLAALATPLVWLLGVETLVASYGFEAVVWWLPGGAGAGITGSDLPGVLPPWLAFAVLTGWGTVLTVPGLRRFVRCDIT